MRRTILLSLALFAAATSNAQAFDPAKEAFNYAKSAERLRHDEPSVSFQAEIALQSLRGTIGLAQALAEDPSRLPAHPCAANLYLCVGDPRLYDWGGRYGAVTPVHFRNRNGAYIAGHVWAPLPRRGEPVRRLPAILIVVGDLAPEQIYWWAAQTLARSGYVVMTFDPQGHGLSDTLGQGSARFRHVLIQQLAGTDVFNPAPNADAVEQTEDALDFFLSRDDPLRPLIDARHVGLAGHSRGAEAVSIVGSEDPRVDTIVAWDQLIAGDGRHPSNPVVPMAPRVPALGMAADYYIGDPPYTSDPDPDRKLDAFRAYRAAGVDAMELVVRGGTHFEWSYIPGPVFGTATLRGIDMAAWYTQAWFDKYLKADPSAGRRLLSDRWRHDAPEAAIDLQGDGNLYSFYYRSAFAFHAEEHLVRCDNLRRGCDALVPKARDGYRGSYSYRRALRG